jgi:hypothetical protein
MDTDTFLAINLLGWERVTDELGMPFWKLPNGRWDCINWKPTKNITQALGDGGAGTVVGAMRKLNWVYTLDNDGSETRATFTWTDWEKIKRTQNVEDSDIIEVYADDILPATAICEAARAALKGK